MDNLKDFGECIITIQACVIKKFLQGFMAPKQKKKKKQGGDDSSKAEEVDEEKRLAEEARVRTVSWYLALSMSHRQNGSSETHWMLLKVFRVINVMIFIFIRNTS